MQNAINMMPTQLEFYNRKCLREGCQGMQSITKILGPHLIIETIMDTFDNISTLKCNLTEIPTEITIEDNR